MTVVSFVSRKVLAGTLLVLAAGVLRGQTPEQQSSPLARAVQAHVQPGDRLAFQLLGEPPLVLTVDEQGRVPLPKLGLVDVSGWPIRVLTDTLTARYAQFYRTPAIELSVQRRITVDGEIGRPDVYYVDPSTTLRDLLAQAGGLSSAADTHKVWIIRHGVRTVIPNWKSDDAHVWDLQSGDEVMVGRRSWLALNALAAISALAVVSSVLYTVTR